MFDEKCLKEIVDLRYRKDITHKQKLGRIGELVVANIFGCSISADSFDTEKDMLTKSGRTVEVKTQCRWLKEQAFVIDDTATNKNIKKCLEVDALIFVEPGIGQKIRVFLDNERKHVVMRPRGEDAYIFHISGMQLTHEFVEPTVWTEIMRYCRTDPKWLV